MYRRSKFLEVLIDIRQEMAREADFDTDLFVELVRSGRNDPARSKYQVSEEHKVSENKSSRRKSG
ncbi:hypothetical protein [Leptolyngbya sp. 7M]|uniref:hypothetical protein n=1 Tax=Leptolyngbya sp. 7M TaxID=2812896 RepID=UPI001B8D38C9|nr:hypothetical protein [Leptolyngbya sp. 7M]QYO67147.1 hypothetical protein JVX88_10275 [Leptolyngbya sp. 7M]